MPYYKLRIARDVPCHGDVEFEADDDRTAFERSKVIIDAQDAEIDYPLLEADWEFGFNDHVAELVNLDNGETVIQAHGKPSSPKVTLIVRGGTVQDVECGGGPVEVIIRDYDTDGVQTDHVSADDDGTPCIIATHSFDDAGRAET